MEATFVKICETAFGEILQCYEKSTIDMVQWHNGLAGAPVFRNSELVAEFTKLYFAVPT